MRLMFRKIDAGAPASVLVAPRKYARPLSPVSLSAAFLLLFTPLHGRAQQPGDPTDPAAAAAMDDSPQDQDEALPALPSLPSAPTTPAEADQVDQTMDDLYPDDQAPPPPLNDTTAERRGWHFDPVFGGGEIYDDNIFISHTNRKSDFVTLLSGGFQFGIGDFEVKEHNYVSVDYTGTGFIFARNSSEDAYDQDALLRAQDDLGPLVLQAEFHFQSLSGADIDVGDRTKRQLYDASLTADYNFDDKFFFEAQAGADIAQYPTELNSENWLGRLSLNYRWSPKDVIGIGAGAGVLDVQHSPDQTYQQLFVRGTYFLSEKFSFTGEVGLEYRQSPGLNRVSPILNMALTYEPEEGTSISLSAYRLVENSASLSGDDYTSTGVSIGAHRAFLIHGDIALAAGYENDAYSSFSNGTHNGRSDNYFYIRPSLAWLFGRGRQIDIYFKASQDVSSEDEFSFRDNEAGIEIKFPY